MQHANQNLKHPYVNVSIYTERALVELSSSFTSEGAINTARIIDNREPNTHKAYRSILRCHSYIRGNINEVRYARFMQGKKLSSRGTAYVMAFQESGAKHFHPNWLAYESEQGKILADNLADMPRRWSTLRSEEQAENDIARDDPILAFAAE